MGVEKSPDAYRTIGEASADVGVPAHVLRFWETKFPQIRPAKRAGGRRLYRGSDVALLKGVRACLQDHGLNIKGVQRLFREQGADAVRNAVANAPASVSHLSTALSEIQRARGVLGELRD